MKLWNRWRVLSPESAKRLLLNVKKTCIPTEHRRKTLSASRKNIRGIEYGGGHRWSTVDKAVMTGMEHHLDRSERLEVDIDELEYYYEGIDFVITLYRSEQSGS